MFTTSQQRLFRKIELDILDPIGKMDVGTKVDKNENYILTPWNLCGEVIAKIKEYAGTLDDKTFLVIDTVEFIPVLLAFGVKSSKITYIAPYAHKGDIAAELGARVVRDSLLTWENNMKFDVVVGNPPYQEVVGNSKKSIGTALIKKFYKVVEDNGYLTMVSASNFLGGGQHGLGYMFTQNKTILIRTNLKKYFKDISFDICSFLIQKSGGDSKEINIENNGITFKMDISSFIYNNDKPYIPKNVNEITLPILSKIVKGRSDIFEFRSSVSKGMNHKIAFWAGASTGIHPRYLKITNTGDFGKDRISHPCGLDKAYPEENIKSVFAGKLFHWTLNTINGNQGTDQPATLAYFPKVSLDRKWTFKELCDEFKLTDDERKVVEDWAATRKNVEWFD